MRKLGALAGLLVFLPVARADLVGKEAPEISVKEWINGDGRTSLKDFRGEVVLLEFWQSH